MHSTVSASTTSSSPVYFFGPSSVANGGEDLLRSVKNVQLGLVISITGTVPMKLDIRLGDAIVSSADDENDAAFSYDHGKTI